MTGNNLDACLKQFSLEKYLSNFKSRGINRRSELASLTMQDYPSLGITSMKDREKLFHMIQNLKAAEEKENAKTSRQNELKGDKSKVSCKVFTEQRESSKSFYTVKNIAIPNFIVIASPHRCYAPMRLQW